MGIGVGTVVSGKVTGITKFGAFVALEEGKMGMVHISEVANTFVNDIREHLTEGQEVKVKVLSVSPEGSRINLSIKKALEPSPEHVRMSRPAVRSSMARRAPGQPLTFEDKLKQFMADSESKISDLKHNTDRRGSRRGRR